MPYQETLLSLCLATEQNIVSQKPLNLAQWLQIKSVLQQKQVSHQALLGYSADELMRLFAFPPAFAQRIYALLHRDFNLLFALEHYKAQGITLLTYESPLFPLRIKERCQQNCPPILLAKGDVSLLQKQAKGIVSSRLITPQDEGFVTDLLPSMLVNDSVLAMGGINGVMTAAKAKAKAMGVPTIVVLANSLSQTSGHAFPRISDPEDGLLLSLPPYQNADFEIRAVTRNLLVMALSDYTVIVKAEAEKGSTYRSAIEALAHNICPLYCQDNERYQGNVKLIRQGALSMKGNFTPYKFS